MKTAKPSRESAARPKRLSRSAPVIDRSPLPMLEVEGPRHITSFVNAAFCRLVGKKRSEMIGQPFAKIVTNGASCVPLLNRVYATGKHETHSQPDDSRSNRTYWLYSMWPALDAKDRPERVVIQLSRSAHAHQNITEMNEALLVSGLRQHELRVQAEESNARSQHQIAQGKAAEGALQDANDELHRARGVAERASKAKDDFLAALSHELRTPLTPVLLSAAALREDLRLPADVRTQLGMMERNIALEARLIDDLLDLTKITHGKLTLRSEPCDAHSLIGMAIEIVREDARDKQISIERNFTAIRSGLIADPARFQQVIWNLLRNAVKFTPSGGKISVRTVEEVRGNGETWLRIEVTDTGIGINAEGLDQIFMPFDQGGLTGDHRFGGVGLGLAIARAVVVLHGGRITALSPGANCGATFVVELPGAMEPQPGILDSERTALAPARGSRKAAIQPQRLLLVEDHENTLMVLTSLLKRDGHHVISATTVAGALAQASVNEFDLVISDLGLPDGTGVELMKRLTLLYGLRGIALSGYGMEEDLIRSRGAGFASHLVKPVSIAELRRVIASMTAVNPRPDEPGPRSAP